MGIMSKENLKNIREEFNGKLKILDRNQEIIESRITDIVDNVRIDVFYKILLKFVN